MAGNNPFDPTRLANGRTKLTGSSIGEKQLWSEGHVLEIEHVPTEYKVKFPAYLQNFSDAFTQAWNAEDAYGRMDPIAVYQNTRRALAMSWHVPAGSFAQAKENLDVINLLMSFMYPVYSQGKDAGQSKHKNQGAVLNMGPLVRVKFGNLISNAQDSTKGLMGYVNGFTVDVNTDNGIFHTISAEQGQEYYPQSITLNFELNVLHEHPMGWMKSSEGYVWRGGKQGFPYKTDNPVPSFKPQDVTSTKDTKEAGKRKTPQQTANETKLVREGGGGSM